MSRRTRILLSVLSGLIMVPAWYTWGSGVILFVAFVPLLLIEDDLHKKEGRCYGRFWLPALAFLIFNILASWWIKNASFAGLLVALVVNTLMMTMPFWLFSFTRRKLGNRLGYFSFIAYWIAMEYFYLNAEISWTWFNLGNGFANDIRLIQWYEYTGTLGGTLWVLLLNLIIFFGVRDYIAGSSVRKQSRRVVLICALVLIPVVFSLIRFATYKEEENPYEIVVVQPNIDPYMKFNDVPVEKQLEIYYRIADSLSTENTDYIVSPETFINDNIWLHTIKLNPSIQALSRYSQKYPKAKQVIGITCYGLYQGDESQQQRST